MLRRYIKMGCPYEFYKEEEEKNYFPYLYCNINNGKCIYSKKCLKEERFISMEGELWKECYIYNMNRINKIPNGSYYVQFIKKSVISNKLYLYVVIGDSVERIYSNLEELNQDYVYLRKDKDGKYEVSLVPFVENKDNKKQTKKKKTENE